MAYLKERLEQLLRNDAAESLRVQFPITLASRNNSAQKN